jgi:pimeloyl-ACP methyl ester carboxylesterase
MAATDVNSEFVEMSHGRTRYFEAGSGPAVILIHGAGFLSGGHSWLPVIPKLADRLHVYAIDCLGFGTGDGLDQGYSFAYLVDHIREFQDVMGLDSSFVIGHSMGGWLGVLLAYESPNRVERFVNVAGGGAATRNLTSMVDWQPPTEEAIRTAIARLAGTNIDVDEIAELLVAKSKDEVATGRFRRLMDHMTNPETRQRYNTLRRFPHITAPTLVVWGSNDQTNALELGQTTNDLIPGSKMTVFEGAGHGVPQERPDEFCETVLDFLS